MKNYCIVNIIHTGETTTRERIEALISNKNWTRPQLVEEIKKIAASNGLVTNVNLRKVTGWQCQNRKIDPDNLKLLVKVFGPGIEESDIVPLS